jgi:hypothetical protein
MSVGTFFKDIEKVLAKVFSPGAIQVEASIADIVLPGFAPLINSAATAIITSEGVAKAAGVQSGTGTQKMAYAVNLFQSTYNQWAAQNGLVQEPAAVQNLLQQVFNLLNELNLVNTAAPPPANTTSTNAGTTATNVATESVQEATKTGTLL